MSAGVIWFLVGGAFFLSELFSPVFVLFFFGIGAWAAGLATFFTSSLPVALLVFCVVSVATLLALRRGLVRVFTGRSRLAGDAPDESANLNKGKLGTISKPIHPPHAGEVSLGGSFWQAVCHVPVPMGITVRVIGHVVGDELILRVVPEENVPEENAPEK